MAPQLTSPMETPMARSMVIHLACPMEAPMALPIEALMSLLMHSRTYNITLRACAVHTRGHKSRDGSYFNPDGGGDSQNDGVAQSWVHLIITSLAQMLILSTRHKQMSTNLHLMGVSIMFVYCK